MKKRVDTHAVWMMILVLLLAGCSPPAAGTTSSLPETATPTVEPLPPTQTAGRDTATLVPASPTPTAEACHRIAFVRYPEGDIYSVCPDGSRLEQLTDSPALDGHPAWSPDGTKIAFASERSGKNQIFLMNADGSDPVQMTEAYSNSWPIWLPNGKEIAFKTNDGQGLWWWRVLDLENHQVRRLTEPSYDHFFQRMAWSPDGEKIAYMSLKEQQERNDGSSQIHVRGVDGSGDVALTHDIWANVLPIWSPDGSQIAFLSERHGTYHMYALYVMSSDGTDVQQLTDPIFSTDSIPSWSPDGEQIAIGDEMGVIWIVDLQEKTKRDLLNLPEDQSAISPAWQP